MRPGRGWLYQESSGSTGYSENRGRKENMEDSLNAGVRGGGRMDERE